MTTLNKIQQMRATEVRDNSIKRSDTTDSKLPRQQLAEGGKFMPTETSAEARQLAKKKELDQAVKYVSDYVQNITRELHFTIDKELDRFVVTVLDQETGDVIRQIPTEDMLELAQTLSGMKEQRSEGILFRGDA